ncbi:MarR family transcriptional regulator [Shewanella sp. D64]|uniref:MarR family winged helix-turn-helix transcriptional regulator n=1 Tax=unclassified Shewanella TaxID=196818 RepID=UPI0022BA3287|nr:MULTISPECIES: MarR family transcriptional regulator [unclassified Shewanella]MEC4727347.1 MarR family transcriptional regulator [Shewanella sp. D64]MEC4739502.1 MarR family transcriptional regulator [Shewanella sp. E94]WBJ96829.1 MarR family transcriptional regulator [Shewanella sp. MTB7]
MTEHEGFTQLVLSVFRLNGQLITQGDHLSQPVGLTSARWKVLGAIEKAPQTVSQIARTMGQTRQSVQRIANELEKLAIVSFQDNPEHKTAKLIARTPKGTELSETLSVLLIPWSHNAIEGISEEELRITLKVITKLTGHFEAR